MALLLFVPAYHDTSAEPLQVAICNIALAKLGDVAAVSGINPADGSVQAEYCKRFYPVALASALDQHAWRFATRRAVLSEHPDYEAGEWAYGYTLPGCFINVIKLLSDTADEQTLDYDIGLAGDDQILFTNAADVTLVYTSSSVHERHFTPKFKEYLSSLLAHHLAGPLLKGDVGASAAGKFLELATLQKEAAIERDSQNLKKSVTYTPSGIAARA
jgi:hypothetical protein